MATITLTGSFSRHAQVADEFDEAFGNDEVEELDETKNCFCGKVLEYEGQEFCSERCEDNANQAMMDLGTCMGCGGYGRLGLMCVRDGEECGTYV